MIMTFLIIMEALERADTMIILNNNMVKMIIMENKKKVNITIHINKMMKMNGQNIKMINFLKKKEVKDHHQKKLLKNMIK